MSGKLTTSQVNRLGERLRKGQALASDQEMLEVFRRSFNDALRSVVQILQDLGLQPTERIKTTFSIVQKLNRESIRLSRLQDIAGCRIVVDRIAQQDHLVRLTENALPKAILIDRRRKPTHGYRAVHIVAHLDGRLVEIQIRTELQHLWAVWSEALATALDPTIKYGGGPESVQEILNLESDIIAILEGQQGLDAAGLSPLGEVDLPPSLDVLVDTLSQASLPSELLVARQLVVGMFELALEERKLKERLIHEILALKRKREGA